MSREMIKIRKSFEFVVIFYKGEPLVYTLTAEYIIDSCENFIIVNYSGKADVYDRTDFDFKIKQLFTIV